jgi:acetyl esterase/lipase
VAARRAGAGRRRAGRALLRHGPLAGAYNAAALAFDPRWLDGAGLPGGRGALAGCIALAGPFDWTPRDEPLATIFAPAPGGRLDAAPSDAALAGAPPALLLHGEADTTVGPFHSVRLAERLRAAGGAPELRLYPGVGHIGIVAAFAAPLRALGLERAPVLEDVAAFVGASDFGVGAEQRPSSARRSWPHAPSRRWTPPRISWHTGLDIQGESHAALHQGRRDGRTGRAVGAAARASPSRTR